MQHLLSSAGCDVWGRSTHRSFHACTNTHIQHAYMWTHKYKHAHTSLWLRPLYYYHVLLFHEEKECFPSLPTFKSLYTYLVSNPHFCLFMYLIYLWFSCIIFLSLITHPFHFVLFLSLWVWDHPMDPPGATPLKETGSPSLRSHPVSIVHLLQVGTMDPSMLGCWLAWSRAENRAAVSSWVQQLGHAQQALFCSI